MPAKWIELYASSSDAYDFSIRIKKLKGEYIIQFLQISAEYEDPEYYEDDNWEFASNTDRVIYGKEVLNGRGLIAAVKEAIADSSVCYNETPPYEDLLEELGKHKHLRDLYFQAKNILDKKRS